MTIRTQQRKELKSQAHHLNPVILIGNAGLTDAVFAAIDEALTAHELIKIKMAAGDKTQRAECETQICERMNAEKIQSIGRMVVIYRKKPVDSAD